MRALTGVAIACLVVFLAGCSWIPNLNDATGTSAPPAIFVEDVVKRIKCEIYESSQADEVKNKLAWTKDWTAKVNLSLSVVNSGGLTPNVSAVRYVPSAYYNAESATGGKSLSAVQQKFTLGANLTYSENATRTELVVFTVPFGGAKKQDGCDGLAAEGELQGNLGIKEWVKTAFAPAATGLLPPKIAAPDEISQSKPASLATELRNEMCSLNPTVSDQAPDIIEPSEACKNSESKNRIITPDPFSPGALAYEWRAIEPFNDVCADNAFLQIKDFLAKKAAKAEGKEGTEVTKAAQVVTSKAGGPKVFSKLGKTGKINSVPASTITTAKGKLTFDWTPVTDHQKALAALPNHGCRDIYTLAKIMNASARLAAAENKIRDNYTSANQSGKKTESFANGLSANVLKPVKQAEDELKTLNNLLLGETFLLKAALASSYDTLPKGKDVDPDISGCDVTTISERAEKWQCSRQYIGIIKAVAFVVYAEDLENTSTKIAQYIQSFSPGLPIDSMSHTVIFVVTYGAGIAPQWSFINVTSASNPLAQMQGVRTHNLLLAIGPPSENSANIQNQTVANALSPH